MTLSEMLSHRREEFSGKVVMKFKGKAWTYAELDAYAGKVACGLKKLGIRKGDRVGLLMANSPYFVISYFGIVKLGGIVVPINVMLKSGEIAYLLNDAEANVLITSPAFMPLIGEVRSQLNTVRDVIVNDIDQENDFPETISLADMLAGEPEELFLDYSVKEEDIAVFLYTSGTTGNPKGAMLTHGNLLFNIDATRQATESTDADITVCVLPMFHSFAWTTCVALPIFCGGTFIILENFVPQAVIKTIIEEQATIFAGVPAMYNLLLQVPNINPADFQDLRLAYCGGASLPVEVTERFLAKYGVRIFEGYGLSECSPVCTTHPYRGIRKNGSIGVPIPGVECRIVDDSGNEVPRNTPGELLFRGKNVMKGYHKLPEATAEALKDGWMHTGDIGYMDDDGHIFIVDRKKDMIIVSGLNVYPREIEEVLYTHPKVAEAAVVGVPDPKRGEAVKAFVALKQGETATEKEIIKYCMERMANFKLPKTVEFLDALPRTSTGKILKRALVARQ